LTTPELAEAEEADGESDLSRWLRTEPKMVLRVVPSGLEKSTSSLSQDRGYFRLEAHQVLRIVDILTFTAL
jgi:hypothetical protein